MNKLTIIGNLTRDPELRSVNGRDGTVSVCDFTVAVNRRQTSQQKANGQQQEADFFRVTAWRGLGENAAKYLAKGRKVAVVGSVSCRTSFPEIESFIKRPWSLTPEPFTL